MRIKKQDISNFAADFLRKKNVKPIFVAVSGAHLYGFPSEDSDIDIRSCHAIDTKELFHIKKPREVFEHTTEYKGVEMDMVSFEIEKLLGLLIKNNSNVLEQIFAENLHPTIEHKELRKIAEKAISKQVYHPYKGMAMQNYKKFIESLNPAYRGKSIKKYLYVMRSYMAGIHALRTGKIEPDINKLNKEFKLKIVDELVKLKKEREKGLVSSCSKAENAIVKLAAELEMVFEESKLPEKPENIEEIDKFLYKIRLKRM